MEFLKLLSNLIDKIIINLGILGPLFGCFLIIVESIFPILPLCVFITINFLAFGNFWGLIISWIFTIIGCSVSFILFRKGFRKWFVKKIKERSRWNKFMNKITNIKFSNFVLLIALPFTPAFLVNIALGLSDMKLKTFILGTIIGKFFMVYFWGFVGTSLIESLRNPHALLNVLIASLIAYTISVIISKKFGLK